MIASFTQQLKPIKLLFLVTAIMFLMCVFFYSFPCLRVRDYYQRVLLPQRGHPDPRAPHPPSLECHQRQRLNQNQRLDHPRGARDAGTQAQTGLQNIHLQVSKLSGIYVIFFLLTRVETNAAAGKVNSDFLTFFFYAF